MKIIYISPIKLSSKKGEATHFLEVAKRLEDLGDTLIMICRQGEKELPNSNIRNIPNINIPYLTTFITEVLLSAYLMFFVKTFRPNVVFYRGLMSGGIICRIFGIPSVAEANGIYPDEIKMQRPLFFGVVGPILKLRERILYCSATKVICVTNGIKRELTRGYGVAGGKCEVVPNGVNISLFKPCNKMVCRRALEFDENTFYLGFVGSFQPWQGLDTLIQALTIVKERNCRHMKCVLVGDGDEMESLKRMVNLNSLQNEIIFKGRVEYEDVPALINSFDVCLAPFKRQRNAKIGLSPLKLYEYLACAKPVIATRTEGVTEVIEESNCGYLFDADDANALALKIIQCFNERDILEKLGNNGRLFVKEKFSWEVIAQRVKEIFKDITEGSERMRFIENAQHK